MDSSIDSRIGVVVRLFQTLIHAFSSASLCTCLWFPPAHAAKPQTTNSVFHLKLNPNNNSFFELWWHQHINTTKQTTCFLVITRSLHEVHEINATGLAVSVRPHDSTREQLDGFGWELLPMLCHWSLPYNRTFQLPTIGNTNMAD
jgi:hypothetical protein